MKWSYKTVHFELKKEGLLGVGVLDESEIEHGLNDFGKSGWELVSVVEVQDGIIAFFKQPLGMDARYHYREEIPDDSIRDTDHEQTQPEHDFTDDSEDSTEIASEADPSRKKNMIGAIKIE